MCEKVEPRRFDKGYEEAEDAWRDKTGEPNILILCVSYWYGDSPALKSPDALIPFPPCRMTRKLLLVIQYLESTHAK